MEGGRNGGPVSTDLDALIPSAASTGRHSYDAAGPLGLITRVVEAGRSASTAAGRIGRGTTLPPQFGHTPASGLSGPSIQAAHQVHSKVQIRASGSSGGRSQSHHSQLGRSSSTASG